MIVARFRGVVQGVGFRPLIHQIATELGFCGGVYNNNGDAIVIINNPIPLQPRAQYHTKQFLRYIPITMDIESSTTDTPHTRDQSPQPSPISAYYFLSLRAESICLLLERLSLPPFAYISHITLYSPHKAHTSIPSLNTINALQAHFSILPSYRTSPNPPASTPISIPTDSATCTKCLQEIFSPASRFYHYHLCACTHCGARYSIIDSLPYDRERTSMRDFRLCASCQRDFTTPDNRFYHAQPISCNDCALALRLMDSTTILASNYASIELCAKLLEQGEIICIKGLGGFALICDSANNYAIHRLRKAKNRPHKPFAIMCKNIEQARQIAQLHSKEEEMLLSPSAPIVLAQIHTPHNPNPHDTNPQNPPQRIRLDSSYSYQARHCNSAKDSSLESQKPALDSIAPNLATIGILLANTPLHHLLLDLFPNPIIYTSANLQEEPIITQAHQVAAKLAHTTPYILEIDRDILHGIDDSIMRYMDSTMRPIRIARGITPSTLPIPRATADSTPTSSIIALGAGEKITPAIATNTHITITPYIGSLQSPESLARFEENLAVFLPYIPEPTHIISDMHPRFETTTLAQNLAKQYRATHLQLPHHHAHHCAIWAEISQNDAEQILSVVWDGSGLGIDGSVWGGEFLLGSYKDIERVGYFAPLYLLGGEKAIKDPKRIAYILAREAGHQAMLARYEAMLDPCLITLAAIQSPPKHHTTSSVGRIIDGVAHLLGLVDSITYEGQAGALLESLAQIADTNTTPRPYPYTITQDGIIQWQPMIRAICDDLILESTHTAKAQIAYTFLYTLAHIARSHILTHQAKQAALRVGLSGGVFQNKLLCEILGQMLRDNNITYSYHTLVPCNDSGIAFGQAIFASKSYATIPKPTSKA